MDTVFFIASKLFWGLARPDSWIIILFGLGALGAVTNRKRLTRTATFAGLGFTFALALLPVGDLLLRPLEARHPLRADPERLDGIILLGGAEDGLWTIWGPQVRLNDSGERFTEALRLARLYPEALLLFTGGSGALRDVGQYLPAPRLEDTVAGQFFLGQGVAPERLILETRSRNTAENATLARELVSPDAGETWALVTSAFHMERALRSFERAGWQGLVPWPTDFRSRPFAEGLGWDLTSNLRQFQTALREHIGLLAYSLAGR